MAGDLEVHSSLIAWHNLMLGEQIFGPLLAQKSGFPTQPSKFYGQSVLGHPGFLFLLMQGMQGKLNIGLESTCHGPSFVYFCTNQNGVFDPYLQTVTLYCLVLSPTDVQQPEVPPQQLGGILVLR